MLKVDLTFQPPVASPGVTYDVVNRLREFEHE